MNGSELAAVLADYPAARVLLKVGNDWAEVCGVQLLTKFKNAVTIQVANPALDGGVIVVEPDADANCVG